MVQPPPFHHPALGRPVPNGSADHSVPERTPPKDQRALVTADLLHRASRETGKVRTDLLDRVVVVHLGLAHSIAHRYRNRGIELDDLQQVAGGALVRATRVFDEEFGREFLAFAVPSIRGEVRRCFRDQGWIVRPPRRVQEIRTPVLDECDRQRAAGVTPTATSVASALDLPPDDVAEALSVDRCFRADSLDLPVGDGGVPVSDLVADPHGHRAQVAAEARVVIDPHVRLLAAHEQEVLRLRFDLQMSQREIGDRLDLTQSQVSRLLARILRGLREAIGEVPAPIA